MPAAYIVSPLRTPVGKAFKGGLRTKRPDDFCADVIRAVVKQSGVDPALIEDVILGCAMPEGDQGMNVARFALLLAGLPERVPGVTVNRFCSSGLQTIGMAAAAVKAGDMDCVLAGGTESMTMVPMMGFKPVGSRSINDTHPDFYLGMGMTAENVAKEYKISREDQDRFSYESNIKAAAAIEQGLFKAETVAIDTTFRSPGANGAVKIDQASFSVDDGPRADTTVEVLGKLRPAFLAGGSVTAGNSSQMSDGAAMALVCSESFVKKHNLQPMARLLSFAVAGVPPRIMGIGPVEAIPLALKKAGLKLGQIDRVELNEAFASQALAVLRTLQIDPSKVNKTGGAIALGHPLGATGAKLTATLLHGMRRDKEKYGVVSMCIGTGMGAAGVFELL